ncbi:MAG: DNA-directed RNA polymerase subunit K [Methanobacteriota archaeon]
MQKKHTRYEKARIVGARALQIEMGAPVLVELPENLVDPIEIAMYEYGEDAIPITVVRRLPGESRSPPN